MSFAEIWNQYHSLLSILIGFVLTISVYKIPRISPNWKAVIIGVLLILLVGFSGLFYFSIAFLAFLAIAYGGKYAALVISFLVILYTSYVYSWNLLWWHWLIVVLVLRTISSIIALICFMLFSFTFKMKNRTSKTTPNNILVANKSENILD